MRVPQTFGSGSIGRRVLAGLGASLLMPPAASALPPAEDMAHRLAQAEGADRISGLHALLVSQGDRLLFEHYGKGDDEIGNRRSSSTMSCSVLMFRA